MKHCLKMLDLSYEEIESILDLADQLKFELKNGIAHQHLKDKTLAMIFQKSSTRTRVSFEVGMFQLGGHALFLSGNDLQLGRGEPMKDTARVLGRYCDAIMIRTFKQSDVEDLALYSGLPVINGLTDFSHPCQVLADLMTIREFKGYLKGLTMCYIGDGNNMANSLIVGGLKCGMNVHIACPEGYKPSPIVMEFASTYPNFMITTNCKEAAKGADVIITDVWASMGQEKEATERKIAFEGYQVNDDLLKVANVDCMVQHCLPAHRGEEITDEVLESHSNEIFTEAENRLHVQKAILVKCLSH